MINQAHNLSWIDEFIANVRCYIYVREEDQLLIKRPNQVVRLNPTGVRILKALLDGTSIDELITQVGIERSEQVGNFLHAVRRQLEHGIEPHVYHPAVESEPFKAPFSKYPVLSEVALTYRCNLKCCFCYAGCNGCCPMPGKEQDMTFEQVCQTLDTLFHDAKVPSVSFTGGEPTMAAFLPDAIKYAKQLGMRVNLISNGYLIDDKLAGKLADAGLDSAQISLEGTRKTIHDTIVRKDGAFQNSTNAVRHLRERDIHVHTNTTLHRQNLHEADDFPRFVSEDLELERFSMNLVIPAGTALEKKTTIVYYREVPEILERVIEESQKHGVEFMWYSPVPLCIFNTITHGLGNKGCSTCDGLISIAPNGDVLPCASYPEPVGNLLEDGFESIWNCPAAIRFRKKELAHPRCRECEHFDLCNGACPLYWKQVGYGELPFNTEETCSCPIACH